MVTEAVTAASVAVTRTLSTLAGLDEDVPVMG
jgi:hypothetical protein